MTKHALNGFLATSVAFINEVAAICESVGADAAEVSRGLKSERRIGPRAYLAPGDAFAGGTLARDIGFLRGLARSHGLPATSSRASRTATRAHKRLAAAQAARAARWRGIGARGRDVAVWGLTYKPGTDTLRRSSAVELCRWLAAQGASVRAHDPAVADLPADLVGEVELCATPLAAAAGAAVLVVCTAWPEYREITANQVLSALKNPVVIDPGGLPAASSLGDAARASLCAGRESRAAGGGGRCAVLERGGPVSDELSGRTALITGGTHGLGLEIARHYLRAGAAGVCICGRDADALARAVDELGAATDDGQEVIGGGCRRVQRRRRRAAGGRDARALPRPHDPRQQRRGLRAQGGDRRGRLGAVDASYRDQPASARSCLRARLAPHFRRRGYGKIVQLSGGGATNPLPGLSAYAASKAAVVRFAETLAEELRRSRRGRQRGSAWGAEHAHARRGACGRTREGRRDVLRAGPRAAALRRRARSSEGRRWRCGSGRPPATG